MSHLHVDAPKKKCSCDAFGDGPCPVHAEECRLQNERLKREAEALKRNGVICYVIGRLKYVVPHGSKGGSFILNFAFTSPYEATRQTVATLRDETLINIFQTAPCVDYEAAQRSAKETYAKCFPELLEEIGLGEGA